MNEVLEELREIGAIGAGNRTRITIQGGYVDSVTGPDHFSTASLAKALELGQRIKTSDDFCEVNYNILVNDLGITCDSNFCSFQRPAAEAQIHDLINTASKTTNSAGFKLTTTTERHMRNWGFRRIKKLQKLSPSSPQKLLVKTVTNELTEWSLKSVSGQQIILFEERGAAWIAKCSLIMGAYYAYLTENMKKQYKSARTVVIDLCTPADRDKVSKGAEVAFNILLSDCSDTTLQPVICDSSCEIMSPITLTHRDVN